MADPLQERRVADHGDVHTFAEFVQWYGGHPETLLKRWASARSVERVAFDERAVASQLIHAFGAAALHRALRGEWCGNEERAERVALAVLRLDPGLATKLEWPLRPGPWGRPIPERVMLEGLRLQPGLARAFRGWLEFPVPRGLPESVGLELLRLDPSLASLLARPPRGGERLPERVALEVLRLDPGLASMVWGFGGEGLSERVALEALRLDPGCASNEAFGRSPLVLVLERGCSSHLARAVFDAQPSAVRDADTLRTVVKWAAMPLVVDALRLCGPLHEEEALGHLLERFARDRSGMWQAMEAGIAITLASRTVALRQWRWDQGVRQDEEARERAVAAWRHGVVVRRHLMARHLGQVLPQPAAHTIAVLLCGDLDCECLACCRRAQAAVGAGVAGGRGAAHAGEGAPLGQAQEAAPVEEEVEHSEPAAVIHPEEAAIITAEQWTTAVDPHAGVFPRTGLNDDSSGVMLLEFQRQSTEFYDAILNSVLAVWLVAEGVNVRPAWARGRLVLVPGAAEGDFDGAGLEWHVAVLKSHEEAVYAALRSTGRAVMKRPKASDYVPENDSWMKAPEQSQRGNSTNGEAGNAEFERGAAGEHDGQEGEGGDEDGVDSNDDGDVAEFEHEGSGERSGQEGEGEDEEGTDDDDMRGPISPLPFPRQPIEVLWTFVHFRAQASSASVHAQSAPTVVG